MTNHQSPNLVYVFADQMRGSAMGFLQREPVLTPRLDAFALQSRVLTEVASTFPVCTPHRAMLMTGQYPHRNGVPVNCNSDSARYGVELREDARCWSDVLADQGYSLGYIGKWHLDAPYEPYVDTSNNHGPLKWNEWCPPHRRHGFGYWYAYGTYNTHLKPMYWATDAGRDEFHYVDQWGPLHEADKARQFLLNEGGEFRDSDKPFALVVSMNPPHTPYDQVPDEFVQRYRDVSDSELFDRPDLPPADTKRGNQYRSNIRKYLAMITGVDQAFGNILDAIDEAGVADNTIVVFTSDHGDCIGLHRHNTKSIWWEPSFHVPWLIRGPGVETGVRDDLLLASPDIYPTLLGLMGFADVIPSQVQGSNLAAAFAGQSCDRPTAQLYQWLFLANPKAGYRGVRNHRHTLVVGDPEPIAQQGEPALPVMSDQNPWLDEATGQHVVLYDRIDDPYQMRNIAGDCPEIVRHLIDDELRPLLKHADDPFPLN